MSASFLHSKREHSSAPKKPGLPLPNEILDEILSYLPLSTQTLLDLGRTCHQLRKFVNHHIADVSAKIVKREEHRIQSGVWITTTIDNYNPIDPYNREVHITTGGRSLSVLDLLREYLLYKERAPRHELSDVADWPARRYMWRRCFSVPDPMVFRRLRKVVLFLLYLDLGAHPTHGRPPRRMCEMCGDKDRLDRESRDVIWAVEWFQQMDWSMKSALTFSRGNDCRVVLTEKSWLSTVKSVLEEPLQQFTTDECLTARMTLQRALFQGFGWEKVYGQRQLLQFLELEGFPSFFCQGSWKRHLFITRLSSAQRRQLAKCRERKDFEEVRRLTRGVRAMREYCFRAIDKSFPEKLLDPKNRLLFAAVLRSYWRCHAKLCTGRSERGTL